MLKLVSRGVIKRGPRSDIVKNHFILMAGLTASQYLSEEWALQISALFGIPLEFLWGLHKWVGLFTLLVAVYLSWVEVGVLKSRLPKLPTPQQLRQHEQQQQQQPPQRQEQQQPKSS